MTEERRITVIRAARLVGFVSCHVEDFAFDCYVGFSSIDTYSTSH
jgi:hypothetical protein